MKQRKTNAQYLAAKLASLKGAVLDDVIVYDFDDSTDHHDYEGLSLLFRLPDDRIALVDVYQDEEGNGPGWLNLNPITRLK